MALMKGTRHRLLLQQLTAALLVMAMPAADAGVDFSGFFATGREIQGRMDAWNTWQELQGSSKQFQGVTTCEWPADLDPEAITFASQDFGNACYFDSTQGDKGIRCKQGFCKINLYKGDICSFRCVADGVSKDGTAVESPDCGWRASETETHPCAVLECDAPSSSAEGMPRYYPGDVLITPEVKLECQYPGVWRLTANHVPGKCCGWGGCFGVDAGSYSCPVEDDGCSPVGEYNEDNGIMCFDGAWVPVKIKV